MSIAEKRNEADRLLSKLLSRDRLIEKINQAKAAGSLMMAQELIIKEIIKTRRGKDVTDDDCQQLAAKLRKDLGFEPKNFHDKRSWLEFNAGE